MAKDSTKVMLGWKLDEDALDQFKAFCDRIGAKYSDEATAALFVWQFLPAAIREEAKIRDNETFWNGWKLALQQMPTIIEQPKDTPKKKKT